MEAESGDIWTEAIWWWASSLPGYLDEKDRCASQLPKHAIGRYDAAVGIPSETL
jgi:hypothetical protein